MFPANEFVIAAEDAYRRERMVAVRPPRRSRRPKPDRRHRLRQLLVSRTGEAGQVSRPSDAAPDAASAGPRAGRPLGEPAGVTVGQDSDCACAA